MKGAVPIEAPRDEEDRRGVNRGEEKYDDKEGRK